MGVLDDWSEFARHQHGQQHVYEVSGHQNHPEPLCAEHARQVLDQHHHKTMLGLSTGLSDPQSESPEPSAGKPGVGRCRACARQLAVGNKQLKPPGTDDYRPGRASPFTTKAPSSLSRAPERTVEPFRPQLPSSLNGRMLDLYHRTTPEAAQTIMGERRMTSKEHDGSVYFSTHRDGQAEGYGNAVVHVRVPEHLAELDDEFPDGEQHYRVNQQHLRSQHFIAKQAVAEPPADLNFEHTEQPSGGSKWPTEHILTAHTQGGKAGHLRYFTGPRERRVLVDTLQVEHDRQRQGIGSALMDEMQRRHPNASINHGDRTDAGKAWWSDYSKDKTVRRGRTAASDGLSLEPRPDLKFNHHVDVYHVHGHGLDYGEGTRVQLERSNHPDLNHRLLVHRELPPILPPLPGRPEKPRHEDIGRMSYHPETGRVEGVQTHDKYARQGVATNLWNIAVGLHEQHGLARPQHSENQTPEGAAWAQNPRLADKHGVPGGEVFNCACGLPVEYDPIDGWQHLDGSISHDGELYGKSVSDLMGDIRPTARFTPTRRVFTHTCGLDHRLFDDKQHLKPEVRRYILKSITEMWSMQYRMWSDWAKIYFAGSEASEWTSDSLEGNNDFDVLVGVDYDKFRKDNPGMAGWSNQQITDEMNQRFRVWNGPTTITIGGLETGPWDRTTYVNADSYDIRAIKPYAAYDVSADRWVVKPPHLPHWSLDELPKPVVRTLRAADAYAHSILKLSEPERTQQGAALFDAWHEDRSRAFGPNGEGWYDLANLREKWLDQEGIWAQLVDCKHRFNEGLGAASPDWSNTPPGYTAALPKTQKCKYCEQQATKRVIHSEGMAYIPACPDHLDKAKADAAKSVPYGDPDPSNIDAIRPVAAVEDHLPPGYDMRVREVEKTERWGLPATHINIHHEGKPLPVASLSVHQRTDPDTGSLVGHPNIGVDPAHQRKGLATAMYAEMHRRWPGLPIEHSEHRSDDARALDPVLKERFGPHLHYGSATTDALDEVGHREHPHVEHYQSGGLGHLEGDESKSVVGFMPTQFMKRYREHGGDWNGAHSEERVHAIRQDIRNGVGIHTPLTVHYDDQAQWGYVGEGNHRLRAADEEGTRTVPVRVVRNNSGTVADRKDKGIGAPMDLQGKFDQDRSGGRVEHYVPSDVHPYHFLHEGNTAPKVFWNDLARNLEDPEFQRKYAAESRRIAATMLHEVGTWWITPQLAVGRTPKGINHARQVASPEEAMRAIKDGFTAVLPQGSWVAIRRILQLMGLNQLDIQQRLDLAQRGEIG